MTIQQLADAAAAGDADTVGRLLAEDPRLPSEYTEGGLDRPPPCRDAR